MQNNFNKSSTRQLCNVTWNPTNTKGAVAVPSSVLQAKIMAAWAFRHRPERIQAFFFARTVGGSRLSTHTKSFSMLVNNSEKTLHGRKSSSNRTNCISQSAERLVFPVAKMTARCVRANAGKSLRKGCNALPTGCVLLA
jgi:hypothetical protein